MPRPKVLVLASGGVESGLLVREALKGGREVTPLYVKCGFIWEKTELARLKRLLARLKTSKLKPLVVARADARALYGRHWSLDGAKVPGRKTPDSAVYLEGRNVLLLSQAGVVCARRGIPEILIGTLAANPFPDGKETFFDASGQWLAAGLGRRIRVKAPFRRLRKAEIARRAGRDFLALTFSCIHPQGKQPCGKCNKCAEREKAEYEAFKRHRP